MKMFKKFNTFLDDLDSLHERDSKKIRKSLQVGNFIFAVFLFIGGVEILGVVSIWFGFFKSLKILYTGEMIFAERWGRLAVKFMWNCFIISIPGVILGDNIPLLGKILFFSIEW